MMDCLDPDPNEDQARQFIRSSEGCVTLQFHPDGNSLTPGSRFPKLAMHPWNVFSCKSQTTLDEVHLNDTDTAQVQRAAGKPNS